MLHFFLFNMSNSDANKQILYIPCRKFWNSLKSSACDLTTDLLPFESRSSLTSKVGGASVRLCLMEVDNLWNLDECDLYTVLLYKQLEHTPQVSRVVRNISQMAC